MKKNKINPLSPMLVHMNTTEVGNFARAQGGFNSDNELGIPDFTELGKKIETSPDAKEIIEIYLKEISSLSSEEKKEAQHKLENILKIESGPEPTKKEIDAQTSDGGENLGQLGKNGDHHIVILPYNILKMLWDALPEDKIEINPKTGWPQFFWNILLTAALGAAVGSLFGSSSDNIKKPIKDKSFLKGDIFSDPISNFKFFHGVNTEKASESDIGNLKPSIPISKKKTSTYPQHALIPENIKEVDTYEDPNLANIINEEERFKKIKWLRDEELKRIEKDRKRQEFERERFLSETGAFIPPNSNYSYDREEFAKRRNYKKGGEIKHHPFISVSQLIKGDDGGQTDNIYCDVYSGSHVLDADFVSALGDGNTLAGEKRIHEMLEKLPTYQMPPAKKTSVALSSGEFVITPDVVMALGGGSLDKGHQKLEKAKKELRSYKKHSVKEIPEELKNIKKIFKGIER